MKTVGKFTTRFTPNLNAQDFPSSDKNPVWSLKGLLEGRVEIEARKLVFQLKSSFLTDFSVILLWLLLLFSHVFYFFPKN